MVKVPIYITVRHKLKEDDWAYLNDDITCHREGSAGHGGHGVVLVTGYTTE